MASPRFKQESTGRGFMSRTRSYSLKMTETFEQQNLSDSQNESLRCENIFFKSGCLVVALNISIQIVLNLANLDSRKLNAIINISTAIVLALLYWTLEFVRSRQEPQSRASSVIKLVLFLLLLFCSKPLVSIEPNSVYGQ